MINLLGIKRYNQSLQKRLPSRNLKGILKDITLHIGISPSLANHIFVVGPPRSGTTLVRGILAANSKITTTDLETFFFVRRRVYLFSIKEIPNFSTILASMQNKVELFDCMANYLKERDKFEFFMEKTPEHALVLDKLLLYYPHSKFIFVIRDGRDAYSSSFRNPEFNKKVGEEYPKLWKDCVKCYLKNKQSPNMILLKYEELTKNPQNIIENLMDFLQIPFEDRQLDPRAFSQTSMAKQVGHEMLSKHINASSVGAFRSRLSPKQISFFEKWASPELKALGYET